MVGVNPSNQMPQSSNDPQPGQSKPLSQYRVRSTIPTGGKRAGEVGGQGIGGGNAGPLEIGGQRHHRWEVRAIIGGRAGPLEMGGQAIRRGENGPPRVGGQGHGVRHPHRTVGRVEGSGSTLPGAMRVQQGVVQIVILPLLWSGHSPHSPRFFYVLWERE